MTTGASSAPAQSRAASSPSACRAGSTTQARPRSMTPFAQTRTWIQEARNLNLLTIYTQRIQRSADKNMAQLETFQARRKKAAEDDMRQAKLLYQLAQAEGKPYQPESYFTTAPAVRESVFSTAEIVADLSRAKLLNDAKYYDRSGELPEEHSAPRANSQGPTANSHRPPPPTHRPPLSTQLKM